MGRGLSGECLPSRASQRGASWCRHPGIEATNSVATDILGMFHTITQHIARSQSKFVRLRPSISASLRHRTRNINRHHPISPALRQQHHDNQGLGQHQHQQQQQQQQHPSISTVNDDEISHFSRLSALWWDESGEFALLHKMNPHRIRFIREKILEILQTQPYDATTTATANTISSDPTQSLESPRVMEGMDVLDVGCGGGILSEVRSSSSIHSFVFIIIRFIDIVPSTPLITVIESRASRRQYARHRRIGREHWHCDASCCCGSYFRARCSIRVDIGDTHVPAYDC